MSGLVSLLTDDTQIRDNLRSSGLPTDWDQVSGVAVAGAIVSLAAMLIGSVAGALLGERWHTTLARRVADPSVGRSAALRDAAHRQQEAVAAEVDEDRLTRRDVVTDRATDADPVPSTAVAPGTQRTPSDASLRGASVTTRRGPDDPRRPEP